MGVVTVLGPVKTDELGIVLPHEHLFIDLRNQFTEPEEISKKVLADQQVSIRNLGILRRNPYAVKDNLLLSDLELAEKELKEFKKAGGKTIVDATSQGLGRDPHLLKSLALSTGLNVIAGSGYYTYDTHPPDMAKKTIKELADEIIEDLTIGIKKSEVKAGVIGELGTSREIHPNEKKVLLAAAKAHNETGAPILVHIYPWASNGREVVDIFSEEGVQLDKVVICHSDVSIDLEYMKDIMSRGALIEFDNFGKEFYIAPEDRKFAGGVFATDIERVRALRYLIDEGFEKQILISNDICLKIMLHRYGGWGYDHILRNIVPMMIDEGIDKTTINLLVKENPKKWLNFTRQGQTI
jgi:phosphotriesterase-related protein